MRITAPLALYALLAALALVSCKPAPTKEEIEAAQNTFACQLQGERIVIRFDIGEARLLMPDGGKVVLYQIAGGGSGFRYTNGNLELRGKGMEMHLAQNGALTALNDCSQYTPVAN